MSWCDRCYVDHDGSCLEDRKRREFERQLAALTDGRREPCPFCGGRGSGGPYGFVPALRTCSYCEGKGHVTG
jgi:hypothetical protein